MEADEAKYDYDLIVIGGGSGGLACAKEAADNGARVALFDYVKPTVHGTSWGLGGTCVNVGCIPKKLMHYAGLLHASFHDARELGWEVGKPGFSWEKMAQTVNNYVRSLNWGYRTQLIEKKVKYYKSYAKFVDPHFVEFEHRGETQRASGKYVVLAMGLRPFVPKIPGWELAITSDDLFWLKKAPGKTLCVGASYISLECAGFLHEMGFETTVMVRSILLRGFDREMADFIGEQMENIGMRFIKQHVPRRLEKLDNGRIRVHYSPSNDESKLSAEDFDTVMFATGRTVVSGDIGLEFAGVKQLDSGKIVVSNEQTNVKHIFAVGDLIEGAPELTPVAIQAGKLLARRLFAGSMLLMDYVRVPTTVFTPAEYSCCGYDEEEAGDIYGEEDLEIYVQKSTALETDAVHRPDKDGMPLSNTSYLKIICAKSERERIVGLHYCGPNAGEVMQGYALAIKMGATKADLDNVVGIHPTTAEWFTTMEVTKRSGAAIEASGC